ncbi:hypothetical protein [Acidithiobacillus ferrooxidans]|uniref:ATP-binding protein n=1 Tax=Acidithiobacillus ferrooxidans TaxID=920 RepID=A0A2W1KJU4_ACIFR|nr:hypothetical protein [Acidithiobacillus ferrooxidans]MBU2817721.1 ATP-binding protein [Acidithiobacillus ferrooxidans]MCR1342417.1 hypothetical protein [Acidithiobacillus ferrooxidans]PZD82084.1 ATP-binding protein [Acidithiobacillus ferrooxidans]QLK41631.1 ATP-binding protein [Acidithiobacillus ferrooxidans]QZT53574.1 hypothetical protein K7B00_05180 [Acidithiobacillus ferrooxidans]
MTTSHVKVLIHVNDVFDEGTSRPLLTCLREVPGVTQVSFDPKQEHLVVVQYQPDTISSKELLDGVLKRGHQAQLIGL